jgi:hypothetical protein
MADERIQGLPQGISPESASFIMDKDFSPSAVRVPYSFIGSQFTDANQAIQANTDAVNVVNDYATQIDTRLGELEGKEDLVYAASVAANGTLTVSVNKQAFMKSGGIVSGHQHQFNTKFSISALDTQIFTQSMEVKRMHSVEFLTAFRFGINGYTDSGDGKLSPYFIRIYRY